MHDRTTPLLLSLEVDPHFSVEQALADVDDTTKAILRESGKWDEVAGLMAECWLAGAPIAVLTAIARARVWSRIARAASPKDILEMQTGEIEALAGIVRTAALQPAA